jgi:hypothetical protein
MAYQDPISRPQHSPRLDPLPLGANPPLYRDDNGGGNRRAGLIISATIALLAVVGLIMWFGLIGPQIADDPPAAQTATGQGGQVPARIAR